MSQQRLRKKLLAEIKWKPVGSNGHKPLVPKPPLNEQTLGMLALIRKVEKLLRNISAPFSRARMRVRAYWSQQPPASRANPDTAPDLDRIDLACGASRICWLISAIPD